MYSEAPAVASAAASVAVNVAACADTCSAARAETCAPVRADSCAVVGTARQDSHGAPIPPPVLSAQETVRLFESAISSVLPAPFCVPLDSPVSPPLPCTGEPPLLLRAVGQPAAKTQPVVETQPVAEPQPAVVSQPVGRVRFAAGKRAVAERPSFAEKRPSRCRWPRSKVRSRGRTAVVLRAAESVGASSPAACVLTFRTRISPRLDRLMWPRSLHCDCAG